MVYGCDTRDDATTTGPAAFRPPGRPSAAAAVGQSSALDRALSSGLLLFFAPRFLDQRHRRLIQEDETATVNFLRSSGL